MRFVVECDKVICKVEDLIVVVRYVGSRFAESMESWLREQEQERGS
jgi:hypothetical protein